MPNPHTERIRASRSPAPDASWVLTGLDRANHLLVLRGTWLFRDPLDPDRLKAGLGRTLEGRPHLAGRMRKGERVLFTNDGVPFTTAAMPDVELERVQADPHLVARLHSPLSKSRVKKGTQAPMAVRLTTLADGQALSVVCTHACGDGHSFYTMVHDWGRHCAGEPVPEPILDQSLIEGVVRSDEDPVAAALQMGWQKIRWRCTRRSCDGRSWPDS